MKKKFTWKSESVFFFKKSQATVASVTISAVICFGIVAVVCVQKNKSWPQFEFMKKFIETVDIRLDEGGSPLRSKPFFA